jgi:hypothetical protein
MSKLYMKFLTLCASIGSSLMFEIEDLGDAGQCNCKRQYLPPSLFSGAMSQSSLPSSGGALASQIPN